MTSLLSELELPTWFRRTRAGQEAIAEARTTRAADRAALAEEIRAADTEYAKLAPSLHRAQAEADTAREAAYRKYSEACAAHAAAVGEALTASGRHGRRRATAERQLRETADPRITELRDRLLHALHNRPRAGEVSTMGTASESEPTNEERAARRRASRIEPGVALIDHSGIAALIGTVHRELDALDALYYEPNDAKVTKEIARIEAALQPFARWIPAS